MKPYIFNFDYEKALFGTEGEKILSSIEKNILTRMAGNVRGEMILDLGTGSGRIAGVLVNKGANVHGVDASKEMLEQARNKKLGKSYRLYQGDITDLSRFKNGMFDKVVSFRVLKYVKDKGVVLREAHRVLRNKGDIILEISNNRSFEQVLRWLDKATKGHSDRYDLIDKNKVVRSLEKIGFEIVDIKPTTKVPHAIWRRIGVVGEVLDRVMKLVTPTSFLSRGLVIKARKVRD